MIDINLNYEIVPLSEKEDINRKFTSWENGKIVRFDEEVFITYYASHHNEKRVEQTHDGEQLEHEVCLAYPVRIRKGSNSELLKRACPNASIYEEVLPLWVSDNIDNFREEVIANIEQYDKSPAVNSFLLNGSAAWLDKDTRVGLMNSTQITKSMGIAETTLWFNGISLTVPVEAAIGMLSQLEMYALQCFNRTAEHISIVSEIKSAEGLISYDYTTGYPAKCRFDV